MSTFIKTFKSYDHFVRNTYSSSKILQFNLVQKSGTDKTKLEKLLKLTGEFMYPIIVLKTVFLRSVHIKDGFLGARRCSQLISPFSWKYISYVALQCLCE